MFSFVQMNLSQTFFVPVLLCLLVESGRKVWKLVDLFLSRATSPCSLSAVGLSQLVLLDGRYLGALLNPSTVWTTWALSVCPSSKRRLWLCGRGAFTDPGPTSARFCCWPGLHSLPPFARIQRLAALCVDWNKPQLKSLTSRWGEISLNIIILNILGKKNTFNVGWIWVQSQVRRRNILYFCSRSRVKVWHGCFHLYCADFMGWVTKKFLISHSYLSPTSTSVWACQL